VVSISRKQPMVLRQSEKTYQKTERKVIEILSTEYHHLVPVGHLAPSASLRERSYARGVLLEKSVQLQLQLQHPTPTTPGPKYQLLELTRSRSPAGSYWPVPADGSSSAVQLQCLVFSAGTMPITHGMDTRHARTSPSPSRRSLPARWHRAHAEPGWLRSHLHKVDSLPSVSALLMS
jgi:hypothetical protein